MWRTIVHTIPEPGRVDSDFGPGDTLVRTDHPGADGSERRDPPPWFLFLASIGACVTSFVAGELDELGIDPGGVEVVQRQDYAEDDVIPDFSFDIRVPEGLSREQHAAVAAAAERCTVKRVIEAGPAFRFMVRSAEQ